MWRLRRLGPESELPSENQPARVTARLSACSRGCAGCPPHDDSPPHCAVKGRCHRRAGTASLGLVLLWRLSRKSVLGAVVENDVLRE